MVSAKLIKSLIILNLLVTSTASKGQSSVTEALVSGSDPSIKILVRDIRPKELIRSAPTNLLRDGFQGNVNITGMCKPVSPTEKRCDLGNFSVWGADWISTIGINPPPDHFITVKQVGPNNVAGIIYFNYSTPVRAAFDPDLKFHYYLVNEKNAVINEVQFDWWRACGTNNINIPYSRKDLPNLDTVQNLHHIVLAVEWRQDVKWCGD